jgi:hypothetical protein
MNLEPGRQLDRVDGKLRLRRHARIRTQEAAQGQGGDSQPADPVAATESVRARQRLLAGSR